MVTSADSGIEYSLQHPSENKEDNSSNEGTLTNNSSLKETTKKESFPLQETLTSSPKRASSLLDVPALKSKGLDRMRKISWVPPSSSFHIPRPESDRDAKPSHLEKLLSLFQHPTSLFSRGSQSDDERKSSSNTPPRKDSSLTSSFWSWGSTVEKDKDDRDDSSSEATDSTLSERVQVSFVDESFSRKLDSKTPSTDTDNTLSEFQSFPTQVSDTSEPTETDKRKVTDTTDDHLVQKCLVLSLKSDSGSNDNRASDADLVKPNDMNRNVCENAHAGDNNKNSGQGTDEEVKEVRLDDLKADVVRPRSFAAVLKSSGSENSLEKQNSPETGQPVDKLPCKVIRGIKENISPENTLTSSMSNTKALAFELTERQVKNQPIVNAVWEVTAPLLDKELKTDDIKVQSDLAPIATIDETCDEAADNNIQLDFIDDDTIDRAVMSQEPSDKKIQDMEAVDLGKDALSYLIFENQEFETPKAQSSLAQELEEAELKEIIDLSPELIIDEAIEVPEVFTAKEIIGLKTSPVIPERAKLKKSNSLEDLSQLSNEGEKASPKPKMIVFKVPESTTPRDIPERRTKLRTRSGSSPKSLPESLNKPCPLAKMDSILSKKRRKSLPWVRWPVIRY
ncbi:hypothetical protein O3G_MSEX013082 [Manduca sexta]|uniref:Uncharacterized protein n=1 Tax=Manduca sexta TaxID=7130 RepID=A0A921ZRN9_MANSE|nr:hypothetical protein O3G_MSEX013082 [Manduca sexta]